MSVLAPANVQIILNESLGELPHFNPDLDEVGTPDSVLEFRNALRSAGGVVISSPEYAHGVPGSLKNALDWVVGSGDLVGKPVALINSSPRSTYAYASLMETLTVMSWRVIPEASIAVDLRGKKLDARAIAGDPELSAALRSSIDALARAIDGV